MSDNFLDKIIKIVTVKEYCKNERIGIARFCQESENNCKPKNYLVISKDGEVRHVGCPDAEMLEKFKTKVKENIIRMQLRLEV